MIIFLILLYNNLLTRTELQDISEQLSGQAEIKNKYSDDWSFDSILESDRKLISSPLDT